MATIKEEFNINFSGNGGDVKKYKEEIEKLSGALEESEKNVEKLNARVKQLGNEQTKSAFKGIEDQIKKIAEAQKFLSKNAESLTRSSSKSVDAVNKQLRKTVDELRKSASLLDVGKQAQLRDYRLASAVFGRVEDSLSDRQVSQIEKQLNRFQSGKLSTLDFSRNIGRISKKYSSAYQNALEKNTMTEAQRKHEKDIMDAEGKWSLQRAKAAAVTEESEAKIQALRDKAAAQLKEEVEQEKIKTEYQREQAKIKQEGSRRQEEAKSVKEESKALNEASKAAKNYRATKDYFEASDAKELRRQQKLAENERARATLYQQLGAVMTGAYDDTSKATQKAELASKRLLETMRHIQEFAETKGFTGTVGLESTDVLRAQQYYNTITQVAIEWKKNHSAEGKAADLLSKMLVDAEGFRGSVNRIHTALGQVASTISSITGIAKQFRQTLMRVVQPITQMVSRLTSQAFQQSLDALKNMELSEIGFGNFFGEFEVPGIMSNIKQNALLSPLSAAQLASYVNQIAPLSNGNSTLATNAAMGVAKMIQYSGGEVTTEMEYVIRNLRDVISKGKATSIDIRQFNRAMPALKKVLQDMGLEDFLKNGELSVSKETAPKLLEAFQKINESKDVGSIFDKTSVTISGLMERLEEQIQLLVIDVADFAGATDWIKNTLHDILEDENGWLTTIKDYLSFVGNDIMRWIKSRDWDRFAETLGEIFTIFKEGLSEGFAAIRDALGGTDLADTLKQIAKALSEFIKGIANSYAWLIDIIKGMSNSGFLGSGVLQAGMGIMGFLSGNAGTLITGLTRGIGNLMGVLNQVTTSAINVMKVWQERLAVAATTVTGFDEAIMLASQASANLAKDFAIMQQMMSGTLTQEEAKQAMMEIEARTRDRLIEAQTRNIASEEAETQANVAAAESEAAETGMNAASASTTSKGGILGALFGGGNIKGTKLGSILGGLGKGAIAAMITSIIGNAAGSGITSALGGNEYQSRGVGSVLSNVGGFAAGGAVAGLSLGPIGAAVGGIAGGIAGLVKTVFDIKGIVEEKRQDELEAVEAQVNSGEYVRQLLDKTENGNRIVSGDFDKINSAAVKLMNEFNQTFPYGTAEALLEFLAETAYNGETLNDMIAASNKSREQNANDLWNAIANETIDPETGEFLANEIAAALYDAGYDNSDIAEMVLEKAVQAFNEGKITKEDIQDIMTKWSSVQTTGGEDLTMSELNRLKGGSEAEQEKYRMYVTQLETLFHDVMKNVIKDIPEDIMNSTEKTALSAQMSKTWVDIITGSFEEANKEGALSLTRFFDSALIDKDNNPFNLGISDKDISNLDNYKIGLYGINDRWHVWSGLVYDFGQKTYKFSDDIKSAMDKWYGATSNVNTSANNAAGALGNLNYQLKNLKINSDNLVNGTDPFGNNFDIRNNNAMTQRANGGIVYKAAGGGIRGVDTVPAMLQAGEYVVRRSAVKKVGLSAMNALNTGDIGYFARAIGRQNVYGDYSNARTWNNTSNDNRKSVKNIIKVYNNSKGARLNRYYGLANRLG